MQLFLLLLARIIPLYGIICLGFFAGKILRAQKETIAALLIYIIAPVVVFDGVLRTPVSPATLAIPAIFFLCACILCGGFFLLSSLFWQDTRRNILAFSAGTGNSGYFGLPVALAIFGDSYLGYVVLSTLGLIIYENSVGFFITARGRHTWQESMRKLATLPTLYAFLLALLLQSMNFPQGDIYASVMQNFRGAYSVLGMMMIGLGIASMEKLSFDWLFTGLAFLAKFVAWPALIGLVILVDSHHLHWFPHEVYQTMVLMAIVPMAANTIAFATHLKTEPEKASMAVLLSTVLALFIIPVVAGFFLL